MGQTNTIPYSKYFSPLFSSSLFLIFIFLDFNSVKFTRIWPRSGEIITVNLIEVEKRKHQENVIESIISDIICLCLNIAVE